jgi:hypothetical protein
MIRKQVYIDEDLDRGLKLVATRTGKPEAEHVRAALRAYLDAHVPPPEQDPLLGLVALVDDRNGPDDVAEQHDHYLYGAPKGP